MLIPTSGVCHSEWHPHLNPWPGLPGTLTMIRRCRQQMLVIPTWAAENSYVPLSLVVSYSILGLFSLKIGKFTFTLRPLPTCTDQILSLDTLVMVNYREFWSLLQLQLPPPEEGESSEGSLGNCGLSCHLCHLPTSTSMLGTGTSSLKSTITQITISHFPIGGFFFQALHPLFNVVCCGRGLGCLCNSSGAS